MSPGQPRVGLVVLARRAVAHRRLVMFPYAGAGAGAYRAWPEAMAADVECVAVQLPGRESRYAIPAFDALSDAADAIAAELIAMRPELPTIFFGHSMGAWLAYEVAYRLRDRGVPDRLVVSGRPSPDRPPRRQPVSELSDEAFVDRLVRLNGTPRAVLQEPELMALMLPVLRADFGMIDRYRHDAGRARLSCPVQVFHGQGDPDLEPADLEGWRRVTDGPCGMRSFEGDHFYLNERRSEVVDAMGVGHDRPGGGSLGRTPGRQA